VVAEVVAEEEAEAVTERLLSRLTEPKPDLLTNGGFSNKLSQHFCAKFDFFLKLSLSVSASS